MPGKQPRLTRSMGGHQCQGHASQVHLLLQGWWEIAIPQKRHFWSQFQNSENTFQHKLPPQNLGKITSETTFGHWKMVIRPFCAKKEFLRKYPQSRICAVWDSEYAHTVLINDFNRVGSPFRQTWSCKHRKNCECCPVSLLIVRQQRLSWIQVLNCQNCNQCLKSHKSLGSLFEGAL